MARISATRQLLPSVLDRLIDRDPQVSQEAAATRNQVLRELRQSVRRDLEELLNTRRRAIPWPADLEELDASLLSYGIPELAASEVATSSGREAFRRAVEDTIRRSEPRFKTVKVALVANQDRSDRTLRFRVDALMWADPVPEEIVFDTALDPITRGVSVKGADGARA